MTVCCQYCGEQAVLLRWEQGGYPYPQDWGPAWKCHPCDAFIRCYERSTRPLGLLADANTRKWRSQAHGAIDPMWQGGQMSRSEVYRWLAAELGLAEVHIGLLDEDGCKAVLAAVQRHSAKY